jgi:hypothetical protein
LFWGKERFAFKDSKRVGYNEASLAVNANAFVQKENCCIEVDWRVKKGETTARAVFGPQFQVIVKQENNTRRQT